MMMGWLMSGDDGLDDVCCCTKRTPTELESACIPRRASPVG